MQKPEHISRVLDRVLERLARAACAEHTGFPVAKASYQELIKIDEERAP